MTRRIIFLLPILLLTACQTWTAAKNDISQIISPPATREIPPSTENPDAPMAAMAAGVTVPCPSVRIMDDLKNAIEFTDMAHPSDKTEVGRLSMSDIQVTCQSASAGMVAEITIHFEGTLGPKARWKDGDEPSFAYPYFVAVTNPQGTVLSKEIFAASVSYGAQENALRQVETISQALPGNALETPALYTIVLGFQLSDEQLAHNRQKLAAAPKP